MNRQDRIARLKEIAKQEADGFGGRLIDDPDFRAKLTSTGR